MWVRTDEAIEQENTAYLLAEQRTRVERRNAKGIAKVSHHKYGTVIVPHSSNFTAIRNAAEFWGCDWLEVLDAQVLRADPEDKPVCIPPILHKGQEDKT